MGSATASSARASCTLRWRNGATAQRRNLTDTLGGNNRQKVHFRTSTNSRFTLRIEICMPIQSLLLGLSQTLRFDADAQSALKPDFPRAVTRQRRLPLPALVARLPCMRAASQQRRVDSVFGAMRNTAVIVRGVSKRMFAKARSHLHMPALSALNDRMLADETARMAPRWRSMRLVAGGATVLMPAIRRFKRTLQLAVAAQRLFVLCLPGAARTVHAVVHPTCKSGRAMLANAPEKLLPADVLLVDRGYPAARLVNLLNERGLKFIIRFDTTRGGWRSSRRFTSGNQKEAVIVLKTPKSAGRGRLELLGRGDHRAGDVQHRPRWPERRADDQTQRQRCLGGCLGRAVPPPIAHRGSLQVPEVASETRSRQRLESVCCASGRGRQGAGRQPACSDVRCRPCQRHGRGLGRQALCASLGLEHLAPRLASSAAASRESADGAVENNAHDRTQPQRSIAGSNHSSGRCQVEAVSESGLQGVSGHRSAALASVAVRAGRMS